MPSSVSPSRSQRRFQALLCATALVCTASVASAASFFTQQSSSAGGAANVCVYMTDSGDEVAGVQMDLSWDASCMGAASGGSRPKCRANADTGKTVQSASRGPSSLRAIMLSFDNVDPIPDGELFCCEFVLSNPAAACNVSIGGLIASTPQGQRTTANVRAGSAPRPVAPSGGGVPEAPQVAAPQAPAAPEPQAPAANQPASGAGTTDTAAADAAPAGGAPGAAAPAAEGGAPIGVGNQPVAQAPAGEPGAGSDIPPVPGQVGGPAAAAGANGEGATGYAAIGEALNAAAVAARTAAAQTPTPKPTGDAVSTPSPAVTAAVAATAAQAAAATATAPAATAALVAATPTPSGGSAGWLGGCQLVPR